MFNLYIIHLNKYNNLKSISINEIPNLKHLFPLSVATDLENWKSLMYTIAGQ